MEYIFFILLILQLMLAMIVLKDLMHPIVILRVTWIFSTGFLLIYKNIWNVSLSYKTVFIFLLGFIFFDAGFLFFGALANKLKRKYGNIKRLSMCESRISYSKSIIVLIILIISSIYICYLSFRIVGSFSTFSDFLIRLRYTMKRTEMSTSMIQFTIRIIESIGISYFLFYVREKLRTKKEQSLYLTIVIISLIMMTLSTGRYRFLAILIAWIYIYVINQRKNGRLLNLNGQMKLVRIGILSVVLFAVFFSLTGSKLLGKGQSNIINNIAIYISGGMVAFDRVWSSISNTSAYFGAAIFAPIYSLLDNLFNIKLSEDNIGVLATIYAQNGFATNVYTFYRQQILDFGIIGIPFVMFFLGMMFSFLKNKSSKEKEVGFWTAIYAYFMFGIITSPFQDMFFTNSTHTIFSVFTLFVMLGTPILNHKGKKGKNNYN